MTFSEVLNENILYYPSIEFDDPSWVNAALCIWEKIYRIVPENITLDDSPEIETAVNEGVIKNIILEKKDIAEAADKFVNFVDNLLNLPDGLHSAYSGVIQPPIPGTFGR